SLKASCLLSGDQANQPTSSAIFLGSPPPRRSNAYVPTSLGMARLRQISVLASGETETAIQFPSTAASHIPVSGSIRMGAANRAYGRPWLSPQPPPSRVFLPPPRPPARSAPAPATAAAAAATPARADRRVRPEP